MRDTILRLVNLSSGIIAQKLLLDMQAEYGPTMLDVNEFDRVVEELVNKGSIIRVQYVIPPNSHKMRTGALYLPARSVVIVNSPNNLRFKTQR